MHPHRIRGSQSIGVRLLVRLFLPATALAITACSDAQSDEPGSTRIATDTSETEIDAIRVERGRSMFMVRPANCAHCHLEGAVGSDWAPNLTTGTFLHSDGTIEGIQQTIIAGVAEDQIKMSFTVSMKPSSHRGITDDQCLDLAHYVRSLSQ